MDSERIEYCEQKIREELEKYDPVIKAKIYLKSRPQLGIKDLTGDSAIEKVYGFIATHFVNQRSKAIFSFGAISGNTNINLFKYPDIPMEIQNIYNQFEANCNAFLEENNCWDLYRKDILRGIAYHEWLKNSFQLSEGEIEQGFYVKEDIRDYKNLPINLRVEYPEGSGKIYYVYPQSISKGMLSKKSLEKYTALFKLKAQAKIKNILNGEYRTPITNGIAGERSSEIEKESFKYSLYEELVSNYKSKNKNDEELESKVKNEDETPVSKICTEIIGAADIWFIKNTLSSNLVESLSLVLNNSRNMDNYDRELIGMISGCIPPSIRIYLLEALKPAYIYIRTVIKSNRDGNIIDASYRAIFKKLNFVIAEINRIYLKAVWEISNILEYVNISANDLIKKDETVMDSIEYNDDLPFIKDYEISLFNYAQKVSKYTSKETKIKQRVAFYVISALQLHFSEPPILNSIDVDYQNSVLSFMQSFNFRLGNIIYGGYYKGNMNEKKP